MSGSHFQLRQLPTSPSVPSIFPSLFVSVISSTLFVAVYEMNKTHTPSPISHSSPNTHLCNLSFLFLSFHSFISLILSQLYGCLMLSPCCRERTEHPSSSGGMAVMVCVCGGGVQSPHALLCCRTLAPPGWNDARRLGIRPWPWSRQRASTAPSFHQQIWATSMWASSRRTRCWLINRRGCWGGNGEGRFASVSEIPARPLWLQDEACQSDLEGHEAEIFMSKPDGLVDVVPSKIRFEDSDVRLPFS